VDGDDLIVSGRESSQMVEEYLANCSGLAKPG
jgi:hypothetical protein